MSEPLRPNLRLLDIGLAAFLLQMALLAATELYRAFGQAVGTPPLVFPDVPAPLLAAGLLLTLLPFAALVLLLAALSGIRGSGPELRRRLTWTLGGLELGPGRVVLLLLVGAVIIFGVAAGVGAASSPASEPPAILLLGAGIYAIQVALGWFLIVASARVLATLAYPSEARVLEATTVLVSFLGLYLVGAVFLEIGVLLGAGIPPEEIPVPPSVPFASVPATMGTTAGLAILAWKGWRILSRTPEPPLSDPLKDR